MQDLGFGKDLLSLMPPMVVGFIAYSFFIFAKKALIVFHALFYFTISFVITLWFRMLWIFPLLLIYGRGYTVFIHLCKGGNIVLRALFFVLVGFSCFCFYAVFFFLPLLNLLMPNVLFELLDIFYKFGYMIFGGGQVAVPIMF